MAFELKILEKIHCPRCNGMAEQRIDTRKTNNEFVLVYTVCPICHLNRYSHTTTRKAIVLNSRINKLKKLVDQNHPNKNKIQKAIKELEK